MKEYYYIDNSGAQVGPLSYENLKACNIGPKTPVWHAGLSEWVSAENVEELKEWFNPQVPPQDFGQGGSAAYPYGFGGYRHPQQPMRMKPDNWLVWAILCTVFCCPPFGVVGIVYAAQVDSYWNQGRFDEAEDAAKKAKKFTLIGVICSAVLCFLYIAVYAVLFLFGVSIASIGAFADNMYY